MLDIESLKSATAVDSDGDRLGRVGQVYVSEDGRQPLFVTVHTGLFGTKESFVPLEGADLRDGTVHLRYDKSTIKGAPSIADDGTLTDDEQGSIFDYYDHRAGGSASGTGGTPAGLSGTAGGLSGADVGADTRAKAGTDRRDTTRGADDGSMTLSEERLRVGTQQVETGRARLVKHIVTERQTVTVPLSHDEVRIEREPITDANRGAALNGATLSEEEHEVVLTAERAVVEKDVVAVERVRLGTQQVTEQRQVTEDVRHEEIETTGLDRTKPTR